MKTKNRIQNKKNAKQGNRSEEIACKHLERMGFLFVEPIERAWIIQWKNGRVVGAIPKKKVSGDITAVEPGTCRYTHVEVKSMKDKILWSNLKKHQVESLDQKQRAGCLCLLVWVRSPVEIKVLQWPIPGFGPRKSIKWEDVK